MKRIEVEKSSGEIESFNEHKLLQSLIFAGATPKQAHKIVKIVKEKAQNGISTRKVFAQAFRLLKKESKVLASHYSLSKSIHELGPDGFLFEKFISALFKAMGFETSTNNYVSGKCVKHEVDIIAKKANECIYCECKFHNHPSFKNDLKTALYVQARFQDLKSNSANNLSSFWLISNTKFSSDAIDFAKCSGLTLLGPNYPHKKALGDLAKQYHVQPITCLTTLKKSDAKKLLKKEVLLIKQLLKNPNHLDDLKLNDDQKVRIIKEIKNLVKCHEN